ncbi:hypothetical protein A2U01_0062617, partial [Trifolium medium]|nr:hypothetical protein [Trifolium medium]
KPRGFGNGRENGCEAEDMIAIIAFVAEKQLGRGFAGVTFLANDVVEVGSWNWSLCSSTTKCCCW